MKVLVTGAAGFIGRELCGVLALHGFDLRLALRKKDGPLSFDAEVLEIGEIGPKTGWQKALGGVDAVVHLAGRAHILQEHSADPLTAFRQVNALGTQHLAREAARAGVKRFVFISSVKVNGEGADLAYSEQDTPAPRDAYGISKKEAEDALASVVSEAGLEVVVLRPPLVYGPGVKANFKNLVEIVSAGIPLPLNGINNKRSLIYLGNLVDVIKLCLEHRKAAGEIFMVSDGQDISTADLIRMIAFELKKNPLLFSLNPGILKGLCKLAGKGEELEKLAGNLYVDSRKVRDMLGWSPPFTMQEGIRKTLGAS